MFARRIITFFRVLSLPLIIVLVLAQAPSAVVGALFVLVLALLSDLLEGALHYAQHHARSFFAPFADKVLVSGLLLFFTLFGSFSWFFLVFFIIRDIIVSIVRWHAGREDVQIQGEWYGRALIFSEYFIVLFLLIDEFIALHSAGSQGISLSLVDFGLVTATAISLGIAAVSILHYIFSFGKIIRARRREGKRLAHSIPLVVFTNQKSRGYNNTYRRRLLNVFVRRRKAQMIFLPSEGNLFKVASQRFRSADHIVIAGGDGTFESALNDPFFASKSIGFFPLGAGNAFYSYFYKGKRFEYLRSRFPFREKTMDVLEIEWDKGKRQTLFVGIGIDGEVIRRSSPRTAYGFLDYLKGSFSTIFHVKGSYHFTCTVDGVSHSWKKCVNIIIAKIPYYGYGVRSLPGHVDAADGMVYGTACVNTHSTLFNKPLRLWSLVLPMFGFNKAPLIALKGEEIVLTSSEPFPFQAGGEFIGYTKKLRVRVVRQQKVLVV
ncbi:hypothetical protein HYV86_04830 [Candidatus Woesearchaeota archaeon]|nr:hypothetical protein [Candidatus Woesearchaeota archaeon]